jgi:hypothetical protein
METRALVLTALLLLAACSKITQENFAKVQDGMSEPEVTALLGSPTSTSTVQVLGIAGTHSTWEAGGAVVSIRFVNGKVATKTYRTSETKK